MSRLGEEYEDAARFRTARLRSKIPGNELRPLVLFPLSGEVEHNKKPMVTTQPVPPRRAAVTRLALLAAACVVAGLGLWLWNGQRAPQLMTTAAADDDPRLTFATPYRNVRPEVKYLGDETCARCHASHAETFRRHPMGRSLGPVATVAASQRYEPAVHNPFEALGAQFLVDRQGDRIFHQEVRKDPNGQTFAQTREEVHYVVGSGTHNYSYLIDHDGYLMQSPITWYAQKGLWDFSPGYAKRRDMFERPIFPGCLFCHSNFADAVPDTINRSRQPVFQGYAIGCQRCHRPGALHVERRARGDAVAGVDDTIVNPGRLAPGREKSVSAKHAAARHPKP
jgi:hypothetical protein